jgi:hypothetical protein
LLANRWLRVRMADIGENHRWTQMNTDLMDQTSC